MQRELEMELRQKELETELEYQKVKLEMSRMDHKIQMEILKGARTTTDAQQQCTAAQAQNTEKVCFCHFGSGSNSFPFQPAFLPSDSFRGFVMS